MKAYNKAYHEKAYYGRNRDKIRERMRDYRYTEPEKALNTELKARYGIGLDAYTELLTAQNGVCAICNRPETQRIRGKVIRLAVDHCHKTGKVRGLLCSSCNMALGQINEDPAVLIGMLRYLEAHRAEMD